MLRPGKDLFACRFAKNIALENGSLFYLWNDKGQIHKRRWISDRKVQHEVIESIHNSTAILAEIRTSGMANNMKI